MLRSGHAGPIAQPKVWRGKAAVGSLKTRVREPSKFEDFSHASREGGRPPQVTPL
jgi:hypothetical protein